jgi:putative oxidoreductase
MTTITRTATATTTVQRRTELARELAWTGFRAVVGFLFVCHGVLGVYGAFGGIDGAGTASPSLSLGWWSSVICIVGGALVLVGLWTRVSAIVCSGSMAVGYFMVHQPMGALPLDNMGEPAALYAWAFLAIAAVGPGRYALDTVVRRARAA